MPTKVKYPGPIDDLYEPIREEAEKRGFYWVLIGRVDDEYYYVRQSVVYDDKFVLAIIQSTANYTILRWAEVLRLPPSLMPANILRKAKATIKLLKREIKHAQIS